MVTATCMSCGEFFQFPFPFQFEGDGEVLVAGLTIGPCPHCGGKGMVPDAHAQSLIDVMRGVSKLPLEQLEQMRSALAAAVTEPEKAADELEATNPAFAGVATWPRSSKNRTELLAWVTALLALLAWLLPRGGGGSSAQTERVIVEIVDRGQPSDWSKTRRNDRCPCGSGAKFKRCHGGPPSPWHLGDSAPPELHPAPAPPTLLPAPKPEDLA